MAEAAAVAAAAAAVVVVVAAAAAAAAAAAVAAVAEYLHSPAPGQSLPLQPLSSSRPRISQNGYRDQQNT